MTQTQAYSDGASNSRRGEPTTRERVLMAAGRSVANAIPDIAYRLLRRHFLVLWEHAIPEGEGLAACQWPFRCVGTLVAAGMVAETEARNMIRTFLGAIVLRGGRITDNDRHLADEWLQSGFADDPAILLYEAYFDGDKNHRPAPEVCRHCGRAQ